jgi:hypothetical protein
MSSGWEDSSLDAFGEGTPEGPKVLPKPKFGLASEQAGKSRLNTHAFDNIGIQPVASGGKYSRSTGVPGSIHANTVRNRLPVKCDAPEEKVSTGNDESNLIADPIVSEYDSYFVLSD